MPVSYCKVAEQHSSWPSRENWAEWVTRWLQQEQTEGQLLPDLNHAPGPAECEPHTPVRERTIMWPHLSLWSQRPISSFLLPYLQTCGRSSVWSQFSGRGVLAVSNKVCILWANSGLALTASPADRTHRMSIGNPAARRVTDVERGDCTTCNPYKEIGEEIFVKASSPASPFINQKHIQACITTHLFQHVGWDIPKLWITAAQQRGTELGEANTASLYCPLVERNGFFRKEHGSWGDASEWIYKTYPVTAFEKNILKHVWCSH